MLYIQTVAFLLYVKFVYGQYEGESCNKNGVAGLCINIRKCQSAIDDIKNRKNPQICSFEGNNPIVCCVDSVQTTSPKPVLTTSTTRTTSTTEYIPPFYDYKNNEDTGGGCEPLSANLTSPKTSQKAWDKCIEYQERLVYPCEKSAALTGALGRANHCNHNADELIVGGVDASRAEFPHMVLLGFGDTPETVQWQCGGALISERFILTAGHCTSSRDFGPVTYARLGALKRSDQIDPAKLYRIGRIIKHPDYKPPAKYNDIALLETDREMTLDQFAVPACLHVGDAINDEKASAAGWGVTQYKGDIADNLQKVTLTKFLSLECIIKFPPQRLMVNGYDERTQICYGDRSQPKDTCQGDSGGPLQIKSKSVHCMYTVIGVTSFGKGCGFVGEPAIYTKVSTYVGWIESVVWP